MYCKNLLKRQRQKKIVFYCKKNKRYIDIFFHCQNCSDFNFVRNKPIKKASKKRIFVKKEIYDKVFKRDKGKCRLCGTSLNLHLHHINGRGKDLTNDINNCIILCQHCHLEIVHRNQKKYRPILLELIERRNNERNMERYS